jgi:hypothetical protein
MREINTFIFADHAIQSNMKLFKKSVEFYYSWLENMDAKL